LFVLYETRNIRLKISDSYHVQDYYLSLKNYVHSNLKFKNFNFYRIPTPKPIQFFNDFIL